jgi:outer membrane lipase/esterase
MTSRKTTLAALALALMSTSALAERFVSFGDSLSDNGNLSAATGGAQPGPTYVGGRFSNGTVWVEQLAGSMSGFFPVGVINNSTSTNFAFGGARTDTAVSNPPGTGTQIGGYLARGGNFSSDTVVTVWAGANDIFQSLQGASANPSTAGAVISGVGATAASNVASQVTTLANAGATTVVVLNLPNLSSTPQFSGTPVAQLAGAGSSAYNATLDTALASAAASSPNTNIIRVDINSVFQAVQASPGAFGFTNATGQCIGLSSCAGYLFYDGVHPTTAGHALVAQVVRQYLDAPRLSGVFSALGESIVDERRVGMNRAFDRLDTARTLTPGVNSYFINAMGDLRDQDRNRNRPNVRSSAFGVNFGFDRAFNSALAMSASGTVSAGQIKSGGIMEADTFNAGLDVAATYTAGIAFAKLGAGLGVTRFSQMERVTVGPLKNEASATGVSYNLGVELGTRHGFGMIELSPRARLGWVGGARNAFTETGIVAPLALGAQTVNALVGAGELRATVNLINTPAQRVAVTALIGYERYLTYSGNAITGRLSNNVSRPFRNVTGDPKGPGVIFGAGVSASLGSNWSMNVDYRGSVGESAAVRHGGQVGLRVSF